ncbi:MAG: HD domain-containing protein [Armatimonadetes bacterium]|nr:HD domain-containing protein [Armatimonadota bacterium]
MFREHSRCMETFELEERVKKLTRIGIALSSERNLDKLLELIVDSAREFTDADAGTLYIAEPEKQSLRWEILYNDTLKTRQGGTTGIPICLTPVPLIKDHEPNCANVSAYVANTGRIVNIPDICEADGFDFTGPRRYDEVTGYKSKSMLVLPMKNHEDDIIGVLQLLNAKDQNTGEIIAFDPELVDLTTALASQAAVAITNARLIQELQNLFDAFIKAIAAAMDEKSRYTGGHIRRVAELTMKIAEKVNEADYGPYADVRLTPDQMNELRMAAWMHDIGKITTPEHIVDKATKLETIFDRIELIRARFETIKESFRKEALERKFSLSSVGITDRQQLQAIDDHLAEKLAEADEEFNFLITINTGGEFMDDAKIEQLAAIAGKTYCVDGEERSYLSENEVYNLSIRKGTLSVEERRKMNDHAAMTVRMLSQLPFPKKLKGVSEYAGAHHEQLNGKGYPLGLAGEQIPLQARILAIADIFEALTASDRPYKKPIKLAETVKILKNMVKEGHLDGDLVEIFLKEDIPMDCENPESKPGAFPKRCNAG